MTMMAHDPKFLSDQPAETMTFLLVERFSAMCFIAAIEGLRAANLVLTQNTYDWRIISHDGRPVTASNGMVIQVDGSLIDDFPTDYLFVVASLEFEPPYLSRLKARLRQFDRNGVKLGSLSLGTWILARAGLLERSKCTIHWEGLPAFQDTFPDIDVVNDLYVIDRNRYTSSGGLAGMEMILGLVAEKHGQETAIKIANNFQLDRIRNASSHQRSGALVRMDTMPPSVQAAVELMLANLEEPLTNAQVAKRINTSVRNLERNFLRKLQTSPAKYYLTLRLEKARELLINTNLPTVEIALQCGFSSSSYFAKCFHREFAMRPTDMRRSC
jgi:transcriptional regulator GlxA family with amidase domain